MGITLDATVREIATENPSAIRIFEALGIDYCCGGGQSLEQACSDLHLSKTNVLTELQTATSETRDAGSIDWQTASLAELMQHIVRTHHKFVRQESVRLEALGEKVRDKHGVSHPEVERVTNLFRALRDELAMHMAKEEQILFAHITRLERATQLQQAVPNPPFGTVCNPIRMMIQDHDDAGSLLKAIRKLTNNYAAPADACPSYAGFYEGLKEFERDLHQHIHLENNILFPRAIQLEEAAQR